MSISSFVGYVGDSDFHDGSILSVEQQQHTAQVRVRGASRRVFRVDFSGVGAVRANHPVAMVLYALSEMSAQPPMRRFVFANWDERSDSYLEIDAADFTVHEE